MYNISNHPVVVDNTKQTHQMIDIFQWRKGRGEEFDQYSSNQTDTTDLSPSTVLYAYICNINIMQLDMRALIYGNTKRFDPRSLFVSPPLLLPILFAHVLLTCSAPSFCNVAPFTAMRETFAWIETREWLARGYSIAVVGWWCGEDSPLGLSMS